MQTHLLKLPIIHLSGTSDEMGKQFGEAYREQIQELAEIRIADARRFSLERTGKAWERSKILEIAQSCLSISAQWDRETHEELLGIAEGAQIKPEALFTMQGLTDIRDLVAFYPDADAEGCSSFMIAQEKTAENKLLVGQTWDLQTSNMDYVMLVRRHPVNAPETVSLTLTGCLSLIGMNAEGLSVGTTNLVMKDTQIGIHYLQLLHRLLRCRDLKEAFPIAQEAPLIAAHYYFMADGKGEAIGIERSASKAHTLPLKNGVNVHCNHIISPEQEDIQHLNQSESTFCRQKRLSSLIESTSEIGISDLQQFIGDHENGENAICRHGKLPTDVSTNACVLMSPETKDFYACRGQAHAGEWVHVRF